MLKVTALTDIQPGQIVVIEPLEGFVMVKQLTRQYDFMAMADHYIRKGEVVEYDPDNNTKDLIIRGIIGH
jgi:hypothetical protein